MATDDGGKRTKFQCLIIARFTAATVVAVLAFAGIVVVLAAGLRREDISLSLTHGHIQAAQVLWVHQPMNLRHHKPKKNLILTSYLPVKQVDFWVSMYAHNPAGRDNMNCTITTALVIDMPNAPSFTGMTQIYIFEINYELNLTLKHSLDKWFTMTDQKTLSYIARTYGGMSEFTAMLQVNMTVTSGGGNTTRSKNSTHYCWPVTIGHRRSTTAEAVTCKPSHNIDYAADSVDLHAPPPPPPPSPTRPPMVA